jgi:hypothetical protein
MCNFGTLLEYFSSNNNSVVEKLKSRQNTKHNYHEKITYLVASIL